MTALTKAEIVDNLCKDLGITKHDAKEFVELFYDEIRKALETGNNVHLSGFGNFSLRDKGSRPGRNPKTGEDVRIEPRRVVTFKPGQKLRAKVESELGTGIA